MSVCLVTIAGKEEYADIRQVTACGKCPFYRVLPISSQFYRCDYYEKNLTMGKDRHTKKPELCTVDHVIVVHKR
jgi:hypothetical protein